MSFKIKDYNAFLESLAPINAQASNNMNKLTTQQPSFPLDFDFGLSYRSEIDDDNDDGIGEDYRDDGIGEDYRHGGIGEDYRHDYGTGKNCRVSYGTGNDYKDENEDGENHLNKLSQTPPILLSQDSVIPRHKLKQRKSHNVIEQRYRNKINDKFYHLQEVVPTLRIVDDDSEREDSGAGTPPQENNENNENNDSTTKNKSIDLEGLEPAKKLNKGTILTKSIEYIKFLELKNQTFQAEQKRLLKKAQLMGVDASSIMLQKPLVVPK